MIPSHFICSLTLAPFCDPVCDQVGSSCEHSAILTKTPLQVSQLIPNRASKNAFAKWYKSNTLSPLLNLKVVRNEASLADLEEIYYNETSRVISFQPHDGTCRINFYYSTNTVSIAVNHPIAGTKQQFFRKDVDLKILKEIFQRHTSVWYQNKRQVTDSISLFSPLMDATVTDERLSILIHINDLEKQLSQAKEHLESYDEIAPAAERRFNEWLKQEQQKKEEEERNRIEQEKKRRREEEEEEERKKRRMEKEALQRLERIAAEERRAVEEERRLETLRIIQAEEQQQSVRGTFCTYSLKYQDCFPDNKKFETSSKCVAIGDSGYVNVSDNGTVGFHGIPDCVVAELRKQQNSNIDYICIGPPISQCKNYFGEYCGDGYDDYQWYIVKTNGKSMWGNLPSDLADSIKEAGSRVTLMALGKYGTYYVQFKNGSSIWNGEIDSKCYEIFRNHSVRSVWLGEDNAYFVGYEVNGRYKTSYKNLPSSTFKSYCSDGKLVVRQLLFEYKTRAYFIRYSSK